MTLRTRKPSSATILPSPSVMANFVLQAWTYSPSRLTRASGYCSPTRLRRKQILGGQTHPAPLGNITKEKPGGEVKHRLIQDLRRNSVNSAVVLTERQVLPRPVDHAKDVALLSDGLRKGEVISTLVLDFKNVFMSIPLDKAERRFNCAQVAEPISLSRPKIEEQEASTGHFVVWRVLGFGGRPNPLVYSRAASFAMRSAQALLGPPVRSSQHARLSRSRGQLYVDDPVWTHAGF
jgi:hypothetical protein